MILFLHRGTQRYQPCLQMFLNVCKCTSKRLCRKGFLAVSRLKCCHMLFNVCVRHIWGAKRTSLPHRKMSAYEHQLCSGRRRLGFFKCSGGRRTAGRYWCFHRRVALTGTLLEPLNIQ